MSASIRRLVGQALLVLGILSIGRPAHAQVAVQPGDAFPDFSALDQDNSLFRLSEHRGKVIILHFCAIWCPPCRSSASFEQALTDRLNATIGSDNVEIVDALFQDGRGGPSSQQDALNWRDVLDTPAETLHANDDRNTQLWSLPFDVGVTAIPTYFIIRADGIVSAIEVGFYGEATTNVLLADRALEALLATPGGKARYLKFQVNASGVSTGITRSLSAMLDNAIARLADGNAHNDNAARAAIEAFIHAVENRKGLATDLAASWISQARELLAEISAAVAAPPLTR